MSAGVLELESAVPPVAGVYLLHFEPAYRHARHYTGWSADIRARVFVHVAGGSAASPLVRAAIAAGCKVRVSRVWINAGRTKERALKTSGGAARYCPECRLALRRSESP